MCFVFSLPRCVISLAPGAVWGRLKPSGAVWGRLGPAGAVWGRLHGAIWSHLEPSGAMGPWDLLGLAWGRLGPSRAVAIGAYTGATSQGGMRSSVQESGHVRATLSVASPPASNENCRENFPRKKSRPTPAREHHFRTKNKFVVIFAAIFVGCRPMRVGCRPNRRKKKSSICFSRPLPATPADEKKNRRSVFRRCRGRLGGILVASRCPLGASRGLLWSSWRGSGRHFNQPRSRSDRILIGSAPRQCCLSVGCLQVLKS